MLSENDFNVNVKDVFEKLKGEMFLVVKDYRKIIFDLSKEEVQINSYFNKFIDQYNVDTFCKIVDGQISEDGETYITQEIKDQFKNKIKTKCMQEIEYYIDFVEKYINIFIDGLFNNKSPVEVLLLNNCKQIKLLYELWLGDLYPEKHFEAIFQYITELQELRVNINSNIFNMLYYDSRSES